MMVTGRPRLAVYQFLTPEQVEEAARQPVLTIAQLHLLKQQIEALRRINVQLRAAKYKRRTGQDLPASTAMEDRGAGEGPPLIPDKQPAGGWGRTPKAAQAAGRTPKRGRKPSASPVEAATVSSSEEEKSESEPELSEDETSEESDVEAAVAKVAAASLASPRRQSGRQRKGPQTLKDISSPSSGSSSSSISSKSESEGEGEGKGNASEEEDGQGARRKQQQPLRSGASSGRHSKPGGGAKSAGGSSGKQQKRAAIVVVQGDTAASGASIVLPKLTPVPVEWAVGNEASCSVCGDGEDADGNLMLLCEGAGCTVAVHQQCYGVAKIPKSKWLCDSCKDKLSPTAANCACCPVVGGALRKVASLGRVVPAAKSKSGAVYVHVADALWTPEMTLAEPEAMRGVQLDHMTAVRAGLLCGLCKQAGGAVVQCSFGSCCRPFHVLCGRAAGQILTFRVTDGEPLAFCGMHSGDRHQRSRDAICEGREAEAEAEEQQGEEEEPGGRVASEPPTEYELQRQRNIERNKQKLAAIQTQM